MNRLKKGPVAPSARNHCADGAGRPALSCPAPKTWPATFAYIARSAMIGTAFCEVITAEISASSRAASSWFT